MNTVENIERVALPKADKKCNAIFIVDDDYFMTDVLKETFIERGFENVATFESSVEALSEIKNGKTPAVVITDFCMPKLNGVELLQEIEKINPNIPGIIMTSKPSAAKLLSPKWEIVKKGDFSVFITMLEEKIGNILSAISSNL